MEQQGSNKRKSDTDDWNESYSSSEKKKGPRAPWTSQDMISAMLLVKQGMSITKAAQSLNIPRTTLRDRVTGKVKNVIKLGPHAALSGHDERSLVAYYKMMRKQGYGKAKEMILYMAGKITQKNGLNQPDQIPDETWWQSFCARHNQPLYETEEVFGIPKQQVNEAILNNCYQQLLETFTSNKYDVNFLERPELIFSCNENCFAFDQINKIMSNDIKNDRSSENGEHLGCSESPVTVNANQSFDMNSESSRRSCSVITCVDALGNFLPPMFIHNTRNSDIKLNLPLEKQASNRLEQDFFLIWFHDVFLKNIPRSTGPCVLIFDGNNCFLTKDFIMTAAMKDVIIFCIPASLSHILQPLDLSLDGMFRESWRNLLAQDSDLGTISHSNFSHMFLTGWRSMVTPSVVTERFRTLGIYPYFRQNSITLGLIDASDIENSRKDKETSATEGPAHIHHKDILMRAVDSIGQLDKIPDASASFDSNHNCMRHSGVITRPTMSNLNQPLNEAPVIAQFIQSEDDYRHEFPDVYHEVNSTDDISSSSEDGNPAMTALNSISASHTKLPHEKSPVNSSSSTIAASQRKQNQIISPVGFSSPVNISTHKIPGTSPSFIKNPTALNNRKDSTYPFPNTNLNSKTHALPTHKTISLNTKSMPLSHTHSPSQSYSIAIPRGPPQWLASLSAFEDLLGKRRLQKFQTTFENTLENPADSDPLYHVWRSLKLGYFHGLKANQNPRGNISRQQNIRYQRETQASTTSSLAEGNQYNQASSVSCSCNDNYRTVVTPAGNVSVNKNATVVVIMPEKTEDNTGPSEPTNSRMQTSKDPS